jgi:dTDP-4-amino-4,6-dideoxygalactose transaminase
MRPGDTTEVPLCDIRTSYRDLRQAIDDAVQGVLTSGQVILGPEVAALEREVAGYCGAKHGVGCASGTDALLLALCALDIGPGDEVILPPFTFFATAGSICRVGATPIFADIDPETFNVDPREVERKISPRTKAIMPVHLFGQCADMEPLSRLAQHHSIPVIEDAAQAFGSEHRGRKAGVLGDIACFSFYPTKNLGAFGDAGMVTTDHPGWAEKMACLRVHGMEPKYHHRLMGWNARLDAIHAAILRVRLPYVERWIEARQEAAHRYDALLDAHKLNDLLRRPVVRSDVRHSFNQYVVCVLDGDRDGLMRYLKTEKIGCEIYYPRPLHVQECLAFLGHRAGDFPASEEASRQVLALPMFPEITARQQERVVERCAAYLRKRVRLAA